MKRFLCLLAVLCLSAAAQADETADRLAIRKVIETILDPNEQPARFAADEDAAAELATFAKYSTAIMQSAADNPWSETTKPRLVVRTIRFITPDVALVDAANTQYGSTVMVRRVPALFVMKKVDTFWRVASVRTNSRS